MLGVVCVCFVYVLIFVECVSGCVVCLSGCVQACGMHLGLCASDWVRGRGCGAGRRRALRAVSVWAGAARIAGFPERVPRAGGGRRRRLPALGLLSTSELLHLMEFLSFLVLCPCGKAPAHPSGLSSNVTYPRGLSCFPGHPS